MVLSQEMHGKCMESRDCLKIGEKNYGRKGILQKKDS